MKKFVKEAGGVDEYECGVKYIPGHNPDLVLDGGSGADPERVDLTQYKSQEELHGLFQQKGIRRKVAVSVDASREL